MMGSVGRGQVWRLTLACVTTTAMLLLIKSRTPPRNSALIASPGDRIHAVNARQLLHTEEKCSPVRDIFFLKTRKTGGSAIQNIFMRYGMSNNLSFAVPAVDNLLGYPYKFKLRFVAEVEKRPFNLVCHHIVFDWNSAPDLVRKDAKYIAILRNPLQQLESIFWYSGAAQALKLEKPDGFNSFIANKETFFSDKYLFRWRPDFRNPNLFDFGVSLAEMGDRDRQRRMLEMVDKKFDLVMMKEYFDESLVLLRKALCLSWDDVVVLKVNTVNKPYPKATLSRNETDSLFNWLEGDLLIYKHFLRKFKELVSLYGEGNMQRDVDYLKGRALAWHEACIERSAAVTDIIDPDMKPWHNDTTGFVLRQTHVHNTTCRYLAMSEMSFTEHIQKTQFGENRKHLIDDFYDTVDDSAL